MKRNTFLQYSKSNAVDCATAYKCRQTWLSPGKLQMASECFPWSVLAAACVQSIDFISFAATAALCVFHTEPLSSSAHNFATFFGIFTAGVPVLCWGGPALIRVIPLDEVRRSDYTRTRLERSNNTICSPQVSPTNGGSKVMRK